MAWILQDKRVINSPIGFTDINGTKRTKDIFSKWTKEELLAIEVRMFHAISYDRKFYRQTDFSDETINNEVYRAYTVEDKYTIGELKNILTEEANCNNSILLEPTNSYFIIEEDSGAGVPVSIREDRIKIRKMTDDNIITITNLETYDPYVVLEDIDDVVITPELKNEYLTYSTKLSIRRAMRAMGVESELNVLIANPVFTNEWNDTTSIDFTEALVIQALGSLSVTLDQIKTKIWELLADE